MTWQLLTLESDASPFTPLNPKSPQNIGSFTFWHSEPTSRTLGKLLGAEAVLVRTKHGLGSKSAKLRFLVNGQ